MENKQEKSQEDMVKEAVEEAKKEAEASKDEAEEAKTEEASEEQEAGTGVSNLRRGKDGPVLIPYFHMPSCFLMFPRLRGDGRGHNPFTIPVKHSTIVKAKRTGSRGNKKLRAQ